jgi:hypothetical protein
LPRPVTFGPLPEPGRAVPPGAEIAGVTGQVSGVPFTELGSCDMKSTATLPGGMPVAGIGAQAVAGWPAAAMRPKAVAS